ncbi:hypothetical protein [Mycolicibacterium sp. 018/SC-01/001]|uniref:hypothetical protein n=1 Tax=Mycolicibacterium sp. 018/SC-01/001 TaxID=2592069 RepID=UPI00163D9243|nr:hypothetical protein [Mycolicibacterium sp. 018/SC-01/001]
MAGKQASSSTLGCRVERSPAGECLISVLVSVVVLIGIVWNLPASHLRERLVEPLQPIAESTGLQQKWSMYAPDPISVVETLEVRVEMAEGGVRTWTSERTHPAISSLQWYHWQKLKEQLIRNNAAMPDFVRWVVGELTSPGERPVRATVLVHREALQAPGAHRPGMVTVRTVYRSEVRAVP